MSRRAQVALARPSMGCRRHRLADGGPAVTWSIWGPLEDDELFTRDGDFLVETSTVCSSPRAPRQQHGVDVDGVKEMPIGHVGWNCVTWWVRTPTRIHATGYVREIVENQMQVCTSGRLTLTTMGVCCFVVVAFRSGLPCRLQFLRHCCLGLGHGPSWHRAGQLGEEAVVDDSIRSETLP